MTDHGTTVRRPVLLMQGVSKSFFGVQVLHEVDIDLRAGEVHVLMGENGAGKSTLMKILVGAQPADSGRIVLDGEEVAFGHPAEAQARGISIIYQEFNLLPQRSVAENVFLGREPKRGWLVNRAQMEADTRRILEMLQVADVISPRARVADLSVAQQQMVEIAKALSVDARVLVMDEPTAALSPHEVDALMARIRLLQERGVGILYISHRLPEVFALADRITVLKDGRRVDTVLRDDVRPAQLVAMMVGRELSAYYPPRAQQPPGEVRLRLTGGGGGVLHDIDLEVRAGEIVGVAGLEGSGRTELARALFGADPFERGAVEIDGRPIRIRNPRRAIACGLGFITEDRKGEGLVLGRSVLDNATLALRSVPRRRRPRHQGLRATAATLAERLELRGAGLDGEVQYLSGGNQQKVVLAKWLATEAKVLIFDEPTRGIDVGAKAGIHELVRELADSGVAVLLISSELPEVIGMSDRIVVMRQGGVAGELPAGSSEEEIMLVATGEAATAVPA
jgi:ABC-type sugar transport system ATPase subunit